MKKFVITAETTCDLSAEIIQKHNFKIIPISVILGTDMYKDGVDVNTDQLFDYVKRTGELPKTSAVSVFDYADFFTELRKEYENVIHIALSSKASASCNNARTASEEVPGVYVVDSKALSTGQGLLMLRAHDLLEGGMEVKDAYEQLIKTADKVQTSFVVDTLDYLAKGGRCSSVALIASKILKIHPYIFEKEGELNVKKKYMGNLQRSLSQYVTDLASEYGNYDRKRAFVTHSPCDGRERIEEVIEKVKELFDFEEIIETEAGATVSTHCGKNTIGVLFINE